MSDDQRNELGVNSNQPSLSAPTTSNSEENTYHQPLPSSQVRTVDNVVNDINNGDRGTDDVKEFCRGFCVNNNIPTDLQPTQTELRCTALAQKAREEFKHNRQCFMDLALSPGNFRSSGVSSTHPENSFHGATSSLTPGATIAISAPLPSSLPPTSLRQLTKEQKDDIEKRVNAKKYETRLRNNRRSAHASKVFREVYRCALSSEISKLSRPSQFSKNLAVSGTDLDSRLLLKAPEHSGQSTLQSPAAISPHPSLLVQNAEFETLPTNERPTRELYAITPSLPVLSSNHEIGGMTLNPPVTVGSGSGRQGQPGSLSFHSTGSISLPVYGNSATNDTSFHVQALQNTNFNRPRDVLELQEENNFLKKCCKQQFAFLVRENLMERFRAYQQAEERARQSVSFYRNNAELLHTHETVDEERLNQIFSPRTAASNIAVDSTQYYSTTEVPNICPFNADTISGPAPRAGERMFPESHIYRVDEHSESSKRGGGTGSD